jgi:hypothetical protein
VPPAEREEETEPVVEEETEAAVVVTEGETNGPAETGPRALEIATARCVSGPVSG